MNIKEFMKERKLVKVAKDNLSFDFTETGNGGFVSFWIHFNETSRPFITDEDCLNFTSTDGENFRSLGPIDEQGLDKVKEGFDGIRVLKEAIKDYIDWERAKPNILFTQRPKED